MKTKKKSPIITIIILFAVFALLFYFAMRDNYGQEISEAELYAKVQAGNEIKDLIAQNNIIRILAVDSDISDKEFKSGNRADFYITYSSDYTLVSIKERVFELSGETLVITSLPEQLSLLDYLPLILTVVVVIAVCIIIVKTISGSNKSAMGFGKNKARLAMNTKVKFADVAGAVEEKKELQELVEFLKDPRKFTAMGAKIPHGVLLVGEPGTGKTLVARAVAGESGVPFFTISGSDFVEMFVGVGASRVRDLFNQAKHNMPCIVFIDEIDAVGRQRGTGLGSQNDEREQTLNQLLVEMDGFESNEGIIVMAATNRVDVLDPALLRPGRFDRRIYINMPDVKGREDILKVHAKNKPLDESVDLQSIARLTSRCSGADLANILNEAAILTALDGRHKICQEDIIGSITKVIMGPQKKSRIVTERDRKITAVHEAGHAILSKVLMPGVEQVEEVSIIGRGMAGGYTLSRSDNDDNHESKSFYLNEIAVLLGGRVAEEIIIKDVCSGASNDIERATKIANIMVTQLGMSDKLGTINFGSTSQVFIGRNYQQQVTYSEKTAAEIDDEIKSIIDSAYKTATVILTNNLDKLNALVETLLKKDTIYRAELDMIMEGKTVEEIIALIEQKEAERVEKNKRDKEEAIRAAKEREKQEYEAKLAQLKKMGIITPEEMQEKIKNKKEDE